MWNTIRSSWLALAIAGLASFGVPAARAQHHHHGHSHGHSHGHHHGHSHHHGHHHHYVQPYYYTPAVTYVQPYAATVVANTIPYQGIGLVLRNPEGNGAPVTFTVDGQSQTLDPGYLIRLNSRATYSVAFSRGGNLGAATFQIADGKSYYFDVSPTSGWGLWEGTGPTANTAVASAAPAPSTNPIPSNPAPATHVALRAAPSAEQAPAGLPRAADFDPVRKGDTVVVIARTAEVRNGSEVLSAVTAGKQLKVLDVNSAWVMVDVGQPVYGWLHRRDVRLVDLSAAEAPAGVRKAAEPHDHQ